MPEPSLPGAFAGLDRRDPNWYNSKGVFQPQWFEKLMHISNLVYIGHYLTHSWSAGFYSANPLFNGRQLWKEAFPQLNAQEWGFWFIYLGIPQVFDKKGDYNYVEWDKLPKVPPFTKEQRLEAARLMGMRHAQDLRTKYLKPLMPDIQGAIVYVDFENQLAPGALTKDVLAYYNGIWSEMRLPGKEGIAVRPGVYAREYQVPDFLASSVENTDLFLYKVDQLDHRRVEGKPWIEQGTFVYSPVEEHPLRGCIIPEYKELLETPSKISRTRENGLLGGVMLDRLLQDGDLLEDGLFDQGLFKKPSISKETETKISRSAMLIGRQWVIYKDFFPHQGGKTQLPSYQHIDFNASMVRDLRYPVAMPRIAVLDEIMLRTVFDVAPYDPKGPQTVPTTNLEQVHSCQPTKLSFRDTLDEMLEHEAPLCLLPPAPKPIAALHPPQAGMPNLPGLNEELFSINKNKQVVLVTRLEAGNPSAWSNPSQFLSNAPVLRRNRAMAVTKSTHNAALETKLFYVSYDLGLVCHRRFDYNAWSGTETISGNVKLHTFTNITAVSRLKPQGSTSDIVDIFFIEEAGSLQVITCNTKDWPRNSIETIKDATTKSGTSRLLTGTSMVSVSPSPDETLFFGIGLDCHLYMTSKSGSANWTDLTRIDGEGGPHPLQKTDDRLFPHAKMDAWVDLEKKKIYVACLTAVNVPCLYVLTKSYKWGMFERRYYENKMREKGTVEANAKFEGAPGLPEDYEPKILQEGLTEVVEEKREMINGELKITPVKKTVKRNNKEGYAFNPFGDIKLSMVGPHLTFWIAGVTMVRTKGKPGDRTALLFIRCLLPKEGGEVWKRIKDFREFEEIGSGIGDIPKDLEF